MIPWIIFFTCNNVISTTHTCFCSVCGPNTLVMITRFITHRMIMLYTACGWFSIHSVKTMRINCLTCKGAAWIRFLKTSIYSKIPLLLVWCFTLRSSRNPHSSHFSSSRCAFKESEELPWWRRGNIFCVHEDGKPQPPPPLQYKLLMSLYFAKTMGSRCRNVLKCVQKYMEIQAKTQL